ncbi:DNA-binding SARP family transcriptional activator [Kitasatospora sp. MAA19]|uniref:AfsR/SARP family transcriptional regulator n=1 Tax=Kitasatospora sp. MAA19 TaxID=3035090 RepID=UPI002474E875|nr:BTAD domain-containing putative transcriptional regulator [Kitasatospora sp. MAA19]MDH6708721.1 DNA-binding SARP family transcriptional activator [Kitasatospora sp. MAA19]
MRILLLGPLELRTPGGTTVHIGGARRRAVLTALALDANRVVPVERLLDLAWDHAPPPTARAALQGHIAKLRTLLDDGLLLETRAPGYVLRADPDLIDAHRLSRLLDRARTEPVDGTAVPLLREAVALRRGPALDDCGSTALRDGAAARLETLRVEALEQLAERLLRTGQGGTVTAALTEAVAEHPLRESLVRLAMLCLHQEGRPAEAVAVFEATRRRLAEETGIDPGTGLREALDRIRSDAAARPPAAPARLPREPGRFVGREVELAWLGEQSGTRGNLGAAAGGDRRLLLVTGPAGVGKTALVLRWAHRNAAAFPDGRIGVNLRGFDETEPLSPEQALAELLRALGTEDAALPARWEELTEAYRTLLAGRRVLLVLENARDTEQVLPLLPTEPGCVVVVTSRHRLTGLLEVGGARALSLESLDAQEAFGVLAGVTGRPRLEAEREAAERVVELCEGLPLALRIAGSRLATRPHWRVATLAGELSDERSRLAALATQGALSVAAALELTVRTLPEPAVELFRLLGVHPGQQVDTAAAASLAGTDRRAAAAWLELLHLAHLIEESAPGRFERHNLIRLHARHAAEELPAATRAAALTRLVDHYLAATAAGLVLARPEARHHRPAHRPTGGAPGFGTSADALAWFRTEEPTVRALISLAHRWGAHEHGCRMVENAGYLYLDAGLFHAWEEAARQALTAAEAAGTASNWPHLYSNHSLSLGWLGRRSEALEQSERAVAAADPESLPVLRHRYLSMRTSFADDYDEPGRALEGVTEAVAHARAHGDPRLLSQALNNLAHTLFRADRAAEALDPIEESLALLAGRESDPYLVISTKTHAQVLRALGRSDEAVAQIHRVLELGRAQGNQAHAEFDFADFIGQVMYDRGLRAEARRHWERALELAAEQGRMTRQVERVQTRLARCFP